MRPSKTQISLRICAVWSKSSLSAWRNIASLAIQDAPSEDSDQTARMRRLIWIFVGRTCTKVCLLMLRLIYLFELFPAMEGRGATEERSKTVQISSRTSVQSEPVVSSNGTPAIKYKPVQKCLDDKMPEKETALAPETVVTWTRVTDDHVTVETRATEKTCGMECGFCEQDQVNPKLLQCLHSFCKGCLQKLLCVRGG